jgi:hypothetical protein
MTLVAWHTHSILACGAGEFRSQLTRPTNPTTTQVATEGTTKVRSLQIYIQQWSKANGIATPRPPNTSMHRTLRPTYYRMQALPATKLHTFLRTIMAGWCEGGLGNGAAAWDCNLERTKANMIVDSSLLIYRNHGVSIPLHPSQ